MNKMLLRFAMCTVLICSPIIAQKDGDDAPKTKSENSAQAEYESFDDMMHSAMEAGVLDEPIVMKKPTKFELILRKFGVPLAMRLVAVQRCFANFFRNAWQRLYGKA